MKYASTLAMALALTGCAIAATTTLDRDALSARVSEAPERPVKDVERDSARKPLDVLAFAGIAPGDTIVEIEAGRGYYTDLLAAAVGPEGRVHMINPPFFETFIPVADLDSRLGVDGERLPNVTLHRDTPFDRLPLANGSADLVTWILGPHEVFFEPEGGYTFGSPQETWNEIARVLKSDGRVLAIDHRACPAASSDVGGTLHRIEPRIVETLATAAGLQKADESDLLMTGTDDCTMNVFDPAVRAKTDRFVWIFEKPDR